MTFLEHRLVTSLNFKEKVDCCKEGVVVGEAPNYTFLCGFN